MSQRFRDTIGSDPLRYDLTEISGKEAFEYPTFLQSMRVRNHHKLNLHLIF